MYKKEKQNYKKLERIVRGYANHRRIEILYVLSAQPELSVVEIAKLLKVNFKTISQHITRLAFAGIVIKRSDGTHVRHTLTLLGKHILKFCRTLE